MRKIFLCVSIAVFALTSCASGNSNIISSSEIKKENISSDEVSHEESGEDTVINMAYSGMTYKVRDIDPVKAFNEADNGYKIELVDYSEYYNAENSSPYGEIYECPDNQVFMDIMQGKQIDILPNFFVEQSKYISLAEKGAFLDLNEFLEADEEINRETLNSHVLDLCQINDNLYFLPLSFSVNTLAGSERFVGSDTNWTFEDMENKWEQMPEDSYFSGSFGVNSIDSVYYSLIGTNIASFINYNDLTCSFNSDAFIDILKFVNQFKKHLDYKADYGEGEIFLYNTSISGFRQFHSMVYSSDNDKYTFVGFPSQNGSKSLIDIHDTFSICSNSSPEVQKGAWEFLKFLSSFDYQYELMMPGKQTDINGNEVIFEEEMAFPINIEAFDKRAKEAFEMDGHITIMGVEENEGHFTQEEYDELNTIISNTNQLTFFSNPSIEKLISDSLADMGNGEKTPEEIAELLQNKIFIMINE